MTAAGSPRSLTAILHVIAGGAAAPPGFGELIAAAPLYCERPHDPGFAALGPRGHGMLPVFTSPEQLALARGTVGWFRLGGRDLLDSVPAVYDLLVDLAGPAPLRLRGTDLAVAPVSEVTGALRYAETHPVPMGEAGRAGEAGWQAWQRSGPGRALGHVEPGMLASTDHLAADTALDVLGLRPEQLHPSRETRGERGVAVPARSSRPGARAWRTNLCCPPRAERSMSVWSGPGSNPLSRATVAPAVLLGRAEQEVRGVVLRSGPPPSEAHGSDGRPHRA